MALFTAGSSTTARWSVTVDGSAEGTLTFSYDPSQVPPGVIGGTGTWNEAKGENTPFAWVFSNNVLTWQLQNQDSGYSTLTTYWGTFDGKKTVNGNYCDYEVNFHLGAFSAVYQQG